MESKSLRQKFNEMLAEITKKTGNYDIADKYSAIENKQKTHIINTTIGLIAYQALSLHDRDAIMASFYKTVIPELQNMSDKL